MSLEVQKMSSKSKEQGLLQFLSHVSQHRNRENDPFYFGEEIEYMLTKFDSDNKTVDVIPKSLDVLAKLWQKPVNKIIWKSEFGSYMIESSPEKPYQGLITSPLEIEEDMQKRRKEVKLYLSNTEHMLTVASFPRLGDVKVDGLTSIHPDDLITDLPRYQHYKSFLLKTFQKGVEIKVPVFRENIAAGEHQDILMDSITYGYGCCCLQVTMQAPNLQACMQLYDQLVNIVPVMLALSAASPIYNGYLADIDTRWKVLTELPISRKSEMGTNFGVNGRGRINRSESVHCYTCPENQHLNDKDVDIDHHAFRKLKDQGCYSGLALYIANLFSRTLPPLTSDSDDVHLNQYLNIQSTNWQTVRIKLPTKDSGWTVEFRPMDVQITDFENTAYVVFIMLLSKVIMELKLTFAVPISKVNENIEKACLVDAVKTEKFYIPINICTEKTLKRVKKVDDIFHLNGNSGFGETEVEVNNNSEKKQFDYYSVEEIIVGGKAFVGLLPIIRYYLTANDMTGYDRYLKLIEDRARGTLTTTARAIRDFVLTHPCYHSNSKVNEQVQYDLLHTIAKHTDSNDVMGQATPKQES